MLVKIKFSNYFVLIVMLFLPFSICKAGGYLTGSIPDPESRTLNTSYKVGTTPGALNVSGDGAANYSIPLFSAPGTAGMQPSLSINYNSNGGYHVLGKGWSLGGTSAIYRAASNYYHDGITDPVDFDTNDAFMLDGTRLIKDGSVYKTELESYSVITPTYSGSAIIKFTVKTKDGKTVEYGTGNAKLLNGTNSRYFAWYVTKVQDAYGNYMTYVYDNDATNGIRLSAINYTGNATAGLSTYNSVTFTYIARNDTRIDYVYGQEVKNTLLLGQMKSYAEGNIARIYDFNYIEDDDVSLLAELIETGSDGTRFNSTVFSYHDYQNQGQWINTNLADSFTKKLYGDINGDGRTDLIMKSGNYVKYYTTNPGGQGVTYVGEINVGSSKYEVGDFNGDGLDDIVVFSTTTVKYYRSTGTGFTYVSTSDISLSDIQEVYAYDVGGDHITDIIIKRSSSLYVYKGDASDPFNTNFNGAFTWGNENFFHDFTGDGKNEVCIRNGYNYSFYQFSDNGYTLFCGATYYGDQMIFGDFNGDGKMDFLNGRTKVGRFSGNAYLFDGKTFVTTGFPSVSVLNKENVVSFDSNGDGKYEVYGFNVDLMPYDPDVYECDIYVFDGAGFIYDSTVMSHIGNKEMDFNGDGIMDALYSGSTISFEFFHRGNTKCLLHKIADGLNNKTIIDYENIVDQISYTPHPSTGTYPYANFSGPLYVVSQVKQSNGLGGYFTQNYTYQGGILFKPQDILMGFLQTESTSDEKQTTHRVVNTYHSAYPFVNTINETVLSGQGTNISRTESAFSIVHIANKRIRKNLLSNKTWNDLDNTDTNTSYWANTDGNITRKQTIFSGGAGSTDTYYENYTTVAGSPVPNVPQTIRVVIVRNNKPAFERRTTINYNASNGFITSKVIDPDKPSPLTISYDAVSNGLGLVWKERVSGSDFTTRETVYQWDNKGRFVTKAWSPEGQLTEITNDPKTGNVLQTTSATGYVDQSTYDGFGRLIYNKASDQTIALHWYTGALPNCVYYAQATSPSQPLQFVYYDRLGRDLETKTPAFETGKDILVQKAYDSKGQTTSVSSPYFSGGTAYNTVFTYDDYGRVTEENYANNTKKLTYAYSARQLITKNSSASPSQSETRLFDDMGNPVKVKDSNNNELRYSYNSTGQVDTIYTLDGTVTTQFDAYGRPVTVSDPDAGTVTYTYYATGELKSQVKNGKTTSYTYNRNGQLKTMTESEGTTTYNYNATTGLLLSIDGINNIDASFGYDALGRMNSRTETIDGVSYTFAYQYADSNTDRLSKMTYPGNFAVTYNYSNGYLWEIRNYSGNGLIWQLQETSPLNKVEKYKHGNNLVTTNTYDYKTGMIGQIQTGSIQDWQYNFNEATGNLNWRKDAKHNLQENFGYDNLNRLRSITFGSNTVNIGIDNNGNVTAKDDLGTYEYDASQPHAVSAVIPSGSYSPENQTATYTSFDKLKTLVQGTKNLGITYGYDHGRRKSIYTEGSTTKTKLFIPGGYEKLTAGATTKEFYYISTPAGLTAVYEKVNGSGAMYYLHPDYLGSVHLITNSAGATVQELGFDAWGRQRNATNWTYASLPAPKFDRGYTGHEHLPGFELVNMNGRMYDPVVGRFLSPDPVLQSPGNLQNYNRYSYVLNNPLKYTDPSGYVLDDYYGDFEYDQPLGGGGWMANFGEPGYAGWAGMFSDGVGHSIAPHLDRARQKSNRQYAWRNASSKIGNDNTIWIQIGFYYRDANGNPTTIDGNSAEAWIYEAHLFGNDAQGGGHSSFNERVLNEFISYSESTIDGLTYTVTGLGAALSGGFRNMRLDWKYNGAAHMGEGRWFPGKHDPAYAYGFSFDNGFVRETIDQNNVSWSNGKRLMNGTLGILLFPIEFSKTGFKALDFLIDQAITGGTGYGVGKGLDKIPNY